MKQKGLKFIKVQGWKKCKKKKKKHKHKKGLGMGGSLESCIPQTSAQLMEHAGMNISAPLILYVLGLDGISR